MSTGSNTSVNANTNNSSCNANSTIDEDSTGVTIKLNNTSASTSSAATTISGSGSGSGSNKYVNNSGGGGGGGGGNNSASANGSVKNRGPGRPSKKSLSNNCTWCGENKSILKYVLPTQSGKKEFCSETCISDFRKAYSKGACTQCDNVIRANAPNREFCSTFCMNKWNKQRRNGNSNAGPTIGTNGTLSASGKSPSSQHNNNNVNNNHNTHSSHHTVRESTLCGDAVGIGDAYSDEPQSPMHNLPPARSLQYESFQAFNWTDYLNVDQLIIQF